MPGNFSGTAPAERLPTNAGPRDSPKQTSDCGLAQNKSIQKHAVKSLPVYQGEETDYVLGNENKEGKNNVDSDTWYEGLSKRVEVIEGATNRLAEFADDIKASAANTATLARQVKSIHDLVKGIVTCIAKFTPEQNKIFLTEATKQSQGLARDTSRNIASLETVIGQLTENMTFITAQCAQLHNKVNALASHREVDEEESTAISETLADVGRGILQKLQDLETLVVGDEGGGLHGDDLESFEGVRVYGRQIMRALREVKKMLQAQALTTGQVGRGVRDGVQYVQLPQPLHQGPTRAKCQDWFRFPVVKTKLPHVRFHTPFWVKVSLHFLNNFYITLLGQALSKKALLSKAFLNNPLSIQSLTNNNFFTKTLFLQVSSFLGQTLIIYIFLMLTTWLVPQVFFLVLGPISPMAFAIPPSTPIDVENASQPIIVFLWDILAANVRMVHLQIQSYKTLANTLLEYWAGFFDGYFGSDV